MHRHRYIQQKILKIDNRCELGAGIVLLEGSQTILWAISSINGGKKEEHYVAMAAFDVGS